MHKLPGAGRAFDFEIVAVVMMKLLERFDEQIIDRKPNRSAPIGIAAEDSGLRFGGLVIYDFGFAAHVENVGMFFVIFAERTHAVVAQKFIRIEHAPQQTFHSMPASERDQAPLFHSWLLPARNQTREVR